MREYLLHRAKEDEELRRERRSKMEVKREGGQDKEAYKPLLNNAPCSAIHKAVQAILKCLGLESSSSSSPSLLEEEDMRTETVEERGFVGMVLRLAKRIRRPGYSSGNPGQIN